MRKLTPEEQDAVRHAVNDMQIEGFGISEDRATDLVRQGLAGKAVDARSIPAAGPDLNAEVPGRSSKSNSLK